jgi:hypothetical protein
MKDMNGRGRMRHEVPTRGEGGSENVSLRADRPTLCAQAASDLSLAAVSGVTEAVAGTSSPVLPGA